MTCPASCTETAPHTHHPGLKALRHGVGSVSDRDQCLAVLASSPPMTADAIVVLCGEDARPRLTMACHAFREAGAKTIVLTGGKHDGVRWFGANELAGSLYGMGVDPDRVVIESKSQNTREQAVNVVTMSIDRGWKRLLLVASPYHTPRAFLTFVKAIAESGTELRVVPLSANHVRWWAAPDGMNVTRSELYASELAKCERYHDYVASFTDGLAYLKQWEGQ
jgi:uncharacterized SAM-binding protein YcdF (DUF218 family)